MLEYEYDKTTDNREVNNMENKKMVETIEKKLAVTVVEVLGVVVEDKTATLDVCIGSNDCMKVVLKEMRNQYGTYYRVMSESRYTRQPVKKPVEKKATGKLKTKTEQLCGARRNEIIKYAQQNISSLADGTATFKEIEGAAKDNTVIRFALLLNADGTRFKEDIEISKIRESLAV